MSELYGVLTRDTCTAPELLEVRWQHGSRDTVVRAAVSDLGSGRSRLVLVHERLTERQAPEFAGGWHRHLDTLDAELVDPRRRPHRVGTT